MWYFVLFRTTTSQKGDRDVISEQRYNVQIQMNCIQYKYRITCRFVYDAGQVRKCK